MKGRYHDQICVIGAGINGLATAAHIQKLEPRAKVTLIADKFSPNTTSDMAAGHWYPFFLDDKDTDRIRKWGQTTFDYIEALSHEDSKKYGALMYSGYEFSDLPIKRTTRIRPCAIYGVFYTTAQLTSEIFLPVALRDLISYGGSVEHRKVDDLQLLANDYGTIVNSSGIGANQLCHDQSVYPRRGQVFRVYQPEVKQFVIYEHSQRQTARYYFPTPNWVVVGGCNQPHNWNAQWCPNDEKDIWNDAIRYIPCLKNAPVLTRGVGLRPARSAGVRLEMEDIRSRDGTTGHVVHNYGHGGSGLTLFQGCAKDAASLAIQALHKHKAKM